MRLLASILLAIFGSTAVQAQTGGEGPTVREALNCSREIGHDTEFSTNGNVRADQIFLCVSADGTRAALHYRASAMHNDRYRGSDNSAWLRLRLLDSTGDLLYADDTFDLVEVVRCGGYTSHWQVVPVSANFVERTAFLEIEIGNVGRRSCDPGPTDQFIADVQDTVRRYLNGDLTEEEQQIMSVVGAGGF